MKGIKEDAIRQYVENLAWTAKEHDDIQVRVALTDVIYELEYLLDDETEQDKLANQFRNQ